MLAELGGIPGPEERKNVFGRWRGDIRNLSSPPAVVMLLRMFAAWDFQAACSIAERVPADRLARRMRGGARSDLEWFESLLAALIALGREDAAGPLIDSLSSVDPGRLTKILGPERTARLLLALSEWQREVGLRIATAAQDLAMREAHSRFINDDVSLLWGLGWLAYSLRQYDIPVDLGDRAPWAYLLPQDTPTTLWACAWLKPQPWSEALLARARERLDRRQMFGGAALATAVVVAERRWNVATIAGPKGLPLDRRTSQYFIEVLLQSASKNSGLRDLLPDGFAAHFVDAPHLLLHPARERILQCLS
jgi:hypothetical protein